MSVTTTAELRKQLKLSPPKQATPKELFIKGCLACIKAAAEYYPEFEVSRATNGNTHPERFKSEVFEIYNTLVDEGAIIEAYSLLRLAFGQLTSEQLMKLHREGRLLSERDAKEAARYDPEIPF